MDWLGIIEGDLDLDLVLVGTGLLSIAVHNATMIIESGAIIIGYRIIYGSAKYIWIWTYVTWVVDYVWPSLPLKL